MRIIRHSTGLILALVGVGVQAAASEGQNQQWSMGPVDISLGAGYLTGRSQEKVYDPQSGSKASHLLWDIEQAPTLHAGLTVEPSPWLSLALRGWSKVDSGDSSMVDYDWQSELNSSWSHRSEHPDTRLIRAYQAEFAASFWLLRQAAWQFGVLAGYQRTHYKWEAKGGSYIYSDTGFRDLVGNFPDGELGITYQQTYKAPYLGLTGRYQWQDWQIDASLKASRWVDAEDYDIHHARDTTFADTGNGSRLRAGSLGVTYRLTERASLRGQLDYQEFSEGKGKTRVEERGVREVVHGDASGMSNRSVQGSLGLRYRF